MKGSQLPGEILIILSDTESCYTEYRRSFTTAYFAKTNQQSSRRKAQRNFGAEAYGN